MQPPTSTESGSRSTRQASVPAGLAGRAGRAAAALVAAAAATARTHAAGVFPVAGTGCSAADTGFAVTGTVAGTAGTAETAGMAAAVQKGLPVDRTEAGPDRAAETGCARDRTDDIDRDAAAGTDWAGDRTLVDRDATVDLGMA